MPQQSRVRQYANIINVYVIDGVFTPPTSVPKKVRAPIPTFIHTSYSFMLQIDLFNGIIDGLL